MRSNLFRFRPLEYYISNPEKTEKFYYGKYSIYPDGSFLDSSHEKLFTNPHITETTLSYIMKKISGRHTRVIFSSLFFSCCFIVVFSPFFLFLPDIFPWFFLPAAFPFIFLLIFFLLNRVSSFFKLKYSLAGLKDIFYQDVIHHLSHLIYADNIWHVNNVLPNKNPKDFGGVKQLYHRCPVKIAKSRPFFIESNITIYSINYNRISLYFLPDCILKRQKRSYSYYYYTDLFLYYTEKPSLEKKNPPGDAPVIGQRWLHPNRDGSKDRRYKYNPRIPVLLLSELLVYFKGGFQSYFQISNLRISYTFFSFLSKYAVVAHKVLYQNKKAGKLLHSKTGKAENIEQNTGKNAEQNTEQQKTHEDSSSEQNSGKKETYTKADTQTARVKDIDKATIKAFRMLGVLPGTQFEDVKRNYRLLVKRYHPDLNIKKNDLMLKLAERKIREINKAYDHVVRWFSDS